MGALLEDRIHALNDHVVERERLLRRNKQRPSHGREHQDRFERQLGQLEGLCVVEREEGEEHALVANGGVPVTGELNQLDFVSVADALRAGEVG